MEAHGAGERVAGLALVQRRGGLPAQAGLLQPVQGVEGALDAADLAQGDRQAVLPRSLPRRLSTGDTLTTPVRTEHANAQHVVPLGGDGLLVRSAGDGRSERLARRWPHRKYTAGGS